ncbi:MAG: ABC transporter permease [Anaerolineae bacterium]|nr:ABC transporter permease [Anaerolineae bacterium]MDW8100715.1 ABC transporter permease [Anaerolineae bacterium]
MVTRDANDKPTGLVAKKGVPGALDKLRAYSDTLQLFGVLVVLFAFFAVTEEKFLTARSITSMGFQLPELGVLSLAMMITILTGGINLSVNATSNLAAVLAGFFMVRYIPAGASETQVVLYLVVALLIALGVGWVCGLFNGLLIGYVGVPPILATLATMTLYTGIAVGLTGGTTVTGFPPQLSVIGAQTLAGIPIPFLIFVVLTVLTHLLLYHTSFGFKARMLGSNPTASEFSGVDNRSVLMKVYMYSGLLSAVTGILIMGRTMSAAYEYGTTTYVLLTILIAVLANVIPGFGRVLDVFIAVLILQVLSTGFHMFLAGVRGSSFFKDFAWGVLLILIFLVNYFIRGQRSQG